MNFPKLTQPRLSRILTYVVVVGGGLLPIFLFFALPVPEWIQVVVLLGSLVGMLIYIVRNLVVLMSMDMALALLSCHQTARTRYTLPKNRTPEDIRQAVLDFGKAYAPKQNQPEPAALQYKFSSPFTYYTCGIERVVAAYETELLESENYRRILRSAKANSTALCGTKKARFLDEVQRKAPLHRVTVVLILAHQVDPALSAELYQKVCQQTGDEEANCTLACVVDLAQNTCVFDGLRVPYVGFSYAVKNRGIRMIKKLVFGGNWNLSENHNHIPAVKDLDQEMSLWAFWKMLHRELIGLDMATKRRFEHMATHEVRYFDGSIFVKWDHRGICQSVGLDTDKKIAKVEDITDWYYPKMRPIAKSTIPQLRELICAYYQNKGYTVEFVDAGSFFDPENEVKK